MFNDLNKKEAATLKKDIHKGWVYFWTKRGYPHNIKFTTDIQIKKMSKVYIIQEPAPRSDGWTPDMSTAAEHGALVNVFDKADRIYADTSAAVDKAKSKLKDFKPEEDFLWLDGQVLLIHLHSGWFQCHWLHWDTTRSTFFFGLSDHHQ